MMELPDGETEDETERDGVLSYAAEWHAFAIGFYDGMKSWRLRPGELPENDDVQAEPHYYSGAYVLGTLLQAFVAVALAGVSGVI